MIIKAVTLHNIRSYLSQRVEFPQGTTLLSGDIGSGKSTILLAIEFALFGLNRDGLSGDALLRHGKQAGYVELEFSLDGKEVAIRRSLKRLKDSVRQDEGWLTTNGARQPCTADELKARVLEMAGYPKELLRKSKGLIYRFTVYTPQEEMKRILFEDPQLRLDTLRRVFQIEKYKLVRENVTVVMQALREKKKELAAKTEDLPQKQQQMEQLGKELAAAGKRLADLAPVIEAAEAGLQKKQQALEGLEKMAKELSILKSQLAAATATASEKRKSAAEKDAEAREAREKSEEKTDDAGKAAAQLSENLARLRAVVESMLRQAEGRKAAEEELLQAESQKSQADFEISSHETLKGAAQQLKMKISELEKCPTCLQPVSGEHKHKIAAEEEAKIAGLTLKADAAAGRKAALAEKIKNLKLRLSEIQGKEKAAVGLASELKQYFEAAQKHRVTPGKAEIGGEVSVAEISAMLAALSEAKKKLDAQREKALMAAERKKAAEAAEEAARRHTGEATLLEEKAAEINGKIKALGSIESETAQLKSEIDAAIKERTQLLMQKAAFGKEKESLSAISATLAEEIARKEAAGKELESSSNLSYWLDEMFTGMVEAVERHVMMKVHQEFNELFKEWFAMLMGSENLTARIDEDFTPVVEQDGWETLVENLSGGEKTSCALAYRLALNRVINNLVTTIRTKDLLILDEPTDGFSTEQLDKLRDVLQQLNLPQIILVSHEEQVESFVQNVIRVEKEQHASKIIA